MAFNREALRLQQELQLVVDDQIAGSVRSLTQQWVRAWKIVSSEWAAITKRLAAETVANGAPTRRTLRRARNIQHGLTTIRAMLDEIADSAGGMLADQSQILVREAARKQAQIIAASLPRGSAVRESVLRQALVPNRQLDAIIRRTTQRITSDLLPLSLEATEAVMDQLIVGAARGQNPRAVARQMLTQVQGAFNGGLTRALVVARTEGLDGHREAAQVAQNQHADVLDGWQWLAKLSNRTCPACWGMHGTEHPLTEPGPRGHQQCRCARVPKTKSWRDLGIDIPEPPSLIRNGEQEFGRLPRRQQLEVMGPTRLRALESGRATWDELAQLRHNSGWRDAYYVRPVDDFRKRMNLTA